MDVEVHPFEDKDARRVSVYMNWNDKEGEKELEVVVGYNPIKGDLLNQLLKDAVTRHGEVKLLTITGAAANMRGHMLWFQKSGFKRQGLDRSRSTWSYSLDLAAAAAARRARPNNGYYTGIRAHLKPEIPKTESKPDLFVSTTAGLEAAKQRLQASNLTVPKKLTDEIEQAKVTLAQAEQIEREREALKQSPEWLALEAELQKLRDAHAAEGIS
jgi:ABC-type glycerol-3-phosphate transport system substrate-binding protein